MRRVHTTLAGLEIEYDEPSSELDQFLAKALAVGADPKATSAELVTLIYGADNPIMAPHPFLPGKGLVTREVFENPVYHVLADLVVRKQVTEAGIDRATLGKRYTLTVAEAAERLGISEAAVRKAVQDRRLPAWKHQGERFYKLDPKTLMTLKVGTTGKRIEGGTLRFRAGYDAAKKCMLRLRVAPGTLQVPVPGHHDELPDGVNTGVFETWRRGMVLTGQGGSLRAWWLVPAAAQNRIETGEFFVSGKFEVTMKANNSKAAREAWEAFSGDE